MRLKLVTCLPKIILIKEKKMNFVIEIEKSALADFSFHTVMNNNHYFFYFIFSFINASKSADSPMTKLSFGTRKA